MHMMRSPPPAPRLPTPPCLSAAERKGNTLKGFKHFFIGEMDEGKAIIWP